MLFEILSQKFDTGEILAQEKVSIPTDIFRKELTHRMAIVGKNIYVA